MSPDKAASRQGFTRGEKCVFAHLVVTFVLILLVVVAYFVHLCVVRHGAGDAFRYMRRSAEAEKAPRQAGAVVVRGPGADASARVACGCVAVRPRWSVAPAQCAAARADPALAAQLPYWAVRYCPHRGHTQESGIARSVLHSGYSREEAGNNIALLEHSRALRLPDYTFIDKPIDDGFLYVQSKRLAVAGWRPTAPARTIAIESWRVAAAPVKWESCRRYVSPVVELRDYEVCALLDTLSIGEPPPMGSALVAGGTVLGLASWGDWRGGLPLVILDLASYRDWIETIVEE